MPVWYSLPGHCPNAGYAQKTEACSKAYPGGFAYATYNYDTGTGSKDDWDVTGQWNSTYHIEWAGEVKLDALIGIANYSRFIAAGFQEYSVRTDSGFGTDFWNGVHNATACKERMDRVRWMFYNLHKDPIKFPYDFPEPLCDA